MSADALARACSAVDALQVDVGRLFVASGDPSGADERRGAECVRRAVEHVGLLAADLHLARAAYHFAKHQPTEGAREP